MKEIKVCTFTWCTEKKCTALSQIPYIDFSFDQLYLKVCAQDSFILLAGQTGGVFKLIILKPKLSD